ncbi:MAG TPA: cation-transporting P-type ATPase [Thiobacillaceae bacterium]|nr:cation-transporting P-type ATPase [Thiobacillaceae bacterium]
MRIASLTAEQVLDSLHTSDSGLSAGEAARRLAEYGPNHLREAARENLARAFAREFTHFFALILWFAAALAFAAERFDAGQGMARLGVAIVAVILINGVFSFWQEYKAERAMAALRRLLPRQVSAIRDGELVRIDASVLVPGDLLLLREGDSVPADCRLLEAAGVRVNAANLTGESRPAPRDAEPSPEELPTRAGNLLLAGTDLVAGEGRAAVYATGMHTEFGRIARLTQTAGEEVSPLKREILRLSRIIAVFASGLGLAFFAIGQAIGLPFWASLMFAIGIIVANVPEGLLPTITLSLAMATQRMARRQALVRHLPAVEALGSTTVILSDKTGTLTLNRMAVRRVWWQGALRAPEDLAGQEVARDLLCNAALCQDLKPVNGTLLGDPMEAALVEYAQGLLGETRGYSRLGGLPFDTGRRRMSVLYATPQGHRLYCKGALESLLSISTRLRTAEGDVPLTGVHRAGLLAAQEDMAAAGLRVLAFAQRAMPEGAGPEENDMTLTGLMGLEDPPRPEVPAAVARCATAGIKVIVCTGDHPRTASAIAREIGLVKGERPVVITGDVLRRMSPVQLQLALDAPEILFARMEPEQKLRIVEALKKKGETVAVTGDGVNDAPAIKAAHIGIAMGLSGTDVAKEVADLILLDDNFASIVAAVEEGRAVFENIRKFMTYILTSNIPEIVPYLAFVLFRIPLPLTVIQILAVDLGTDMLPALALGAERPDPRVMDRPPRPRGEPLLTWGLVARAYLFLGMFEAAAALAAFFLVLQGAGWVYGQTLAPLDPVYLQATTACLAAIVVMQAANLFLCREPLKPLAARRLTENPLIPLGLAAEAAFLLAIVFTPAGQWLFGTAPLPGGAWLVALPFALAMVLLEEERKAWMRRRAGRIRPLS